MNGHRALLLVALLAVPVALFAAEPLRAPFPLRAPVQDKNMPFGSGAQVSSVPFLWRMVAVSPLGW
jgi:hypothetical protein